MHTMVTIPWLTSPLTKRQHVWNITFYISHGCDHYSGGTWKSILAPCTSHIIFHTIWRITYFHCTWFREASARRSLDSKCAILWSFSDTFWRVSKRSCSAFRRRSAVWSFWWFVKPCSAQERVSTYENYHRTCHFYYACYLCEDLLSRTQAYIQCISALFYVYWCTCRSLSWEL